MADYYPLLSKAIAGLTEPTAEARQAIYERARRALLNQLRNLDPPVADGVIEREAQALERAVAQLETELMARFGPPPDSAILEPAIDESEFAPAQVRDIQPDETQAESDPGAASATEEPLPAKRKALFARAHRPTPPLKIRREPLVGRPQPQIFDKPSDPLSGFGSETEGPAAIANPDEGSEWQGVAPESADEQTRTSTRLEPRKSYAFLLEARASDKTRRIALVAAVAAVIVALVAIAAYQLRDRPEDLVGLQPPAPQGVGEGSTNSKIEDRVGTGTTTPSGSASSSSLPSTTPEPDEAGRGAPQAANPVLPIARRAALLIEAPDEPSKVKTEIGTVVWRVENVSNGSDQPLGTAVRASIDIADDGLQAEMTIQRNFDATLPASHTIKLQFTANRGSPLANIKQISVVQMRKEDTPTGDSLRGITVPVMENAFLIGLSRGDAEATNLDLLRTREWFDIPMVLANGRIAKLTFEKGPSGRGALEDALASWQSRAR